MIVCSLVISGASARADTDEGACSNRTLSGDYGYAAEGLLSSSPGVAPELQFRSVGVAHFDGKGNLTGVEHTVVNGTSLEADWTANSGTYSVNSNCTGKLVLITPNSAVPLNIFFVLVKHSREFHSILDAGALSSTWIKLE